jgi:septal ring factor EnvC (AmiA/AmiB activator)
MITDDQYKALLEVVYKTKDTVDRLETNWELDRKDFSEFQNRLGHLEVEFKQLRDQILLLPKRTSEKMDGVIDDIKHEAEELKDVIIKKRQVVEEQPKLKKRRWYLLWIF